MVAAAASPSANILVEPRLITDADIDWMNALAKKRYDEQYDLVTTEAWLRNVVLKQPILFYAVRTDNAFVVAMLSILPWLPNEIECNIALVCAEEGCMWEAMKCLRSTIVWAKSRKASSWRVSSETHNELGAMAKRLGATEISPRYQMRLA